MLFSYLVIPISFFIMAYAMKLNETSIETQIPENPLSRAKRCDFNGCGDGGPMAPPNPIKKGMMCCMLNMQCCPIRIPPAALPPGPCCQNPGPPQPPPNPVPCCQAQPVPQNPCCQIILQTMATSPPPPPPSCECNVPRPIPCRCAPIPMPPCPAYICEPMIPRCPPQGGCRIQKRRRRDVHEAQMQQIRQIFF